jgi:hypothetical protein
VGYAKVAYGRDLNAWKPAVVASSPAGTGSLPS